MCFMLVCADLVSLLCLQTSNPDARSTLRGWILTCLCVDLFPPSVKFELYLLNFLVRAHALLLVA